MPVPVVPTILATDTRQSHGKPVSAFKSLSFEISRGPPWGRCVDADGGQKAGRFLLPHDMPGQLCQAFQRLGN